MRYYLGQRLGLACLAFGLLVGCGAKPSREEAAEGGLASGRPEELHDARMVYQRADGIWLLELGKGQPRRLAGGGSWPRWAPDGKGLAFLRDDEVLLFDLAGGRERKLAVVPGARTLAYHPDGSQVWVAGEQGVSSVEVNSGQVTKVHRSTAFYELQVAAGGEFFVGTAKSLGWRVRSVDVATGKVTELGRGCSASLSPRGHLATINLDGHRQLALIDLKTGQERRRLDAPPGLKLDNQKWSNHADWMAVVIEGERQDVGVQRVGDGRVWRLSDVGDADRPDLWVVGGGR
ncbi:MAG: hypothetical protein GX803_07295 [Lentisphaerae bacterium]|jgi:hypothetical protein|nr:hypothetical protein [Lentisphaerota bacterium]